MKAFIFAAGLGTRLKPLTDTMPKALVPINGEPLLGILMKKLHTEGFQNVIINVHHFADQIESYVNSNNGFGMNVQFSDERQELLETGGGILHAKELIGEEPILVHNVDILSNADMRQIIKKHNPQSLATLLVSKRESSRYLLFNNNMRLMGWMNKKTGEIKSPYGNVNPNEYKQLAFAGIHVIEPTMFPLMEGWKGKFSIIDFYLSVADKTLIEGVEIDGLRLLDVGKVDTLREAETFLKG